MVQFQHVQVACHPRAGARRRLVLLQLLSADQARDEAQPVEVLYHLRSIAVDHITHSLLQVRTFHLEVADAVLVEEAEEARIKVPKMIPRSVRRPNTN